MADLSLDLEGVDALHEELNRLEEAWTGDSHWVVGTQVEYGIYLEYGTSKMDPKPFFRPALNELRWKGPADFLDDHTKTTVEEIDNAAELIRKLALALERRIKQIIQTRGLIETGTLRWSITAVPRSAAGQIPDADEAPESLSRETEVSA